jgi:hypothetical protein
VVTLDLGDEPFPERERLRVGVVDPKDPHAFVDPVSDDRKELRPQLSPRFAFEIEGHDVLVFLGRVLGVLDRAVWAVAEPFGVLADVRVVGGALERDVQGDVETFLFGRVQQVAEVVERAELRGDRLMAALRRADGPWAARLARCSLHAVVGTLAVGPPDRVDRRHIEDVEAHAGDVGEPFLDVAESAVAPGLTGRPGKKLVPGAEASAQGIHKHLKLARIRNSLTPIGITVHELHELPLPSGERVGEWAGGTGH